jgi:hypothetical protein
VAFGNLRLVLGFRFLGHLATLPLVEKVGELRQREHPRTAKRTPIEYLKEYGVSLRQDSQRTFFCHI